MPLQSHHGGLFEKRYKKTLSVLGVLAVHPSLKFKEGVCLRLLISDF